jgi:hypothetical protein
MTAIGNVKRARIGWWITLVLCTAVILASLGLILFGGSTKWFTPIDSLFTLLAAIGGLVFTRDRKDSTERLSPPSKLSSRGDDEKPYVRGL